MSQYSEGSQYLPVGCVSVLAIKRKRKKWKVGLRKRKMQVEHIKNFHDIHFRYERDSLASVEERMRNRHSKHAGITRREALARRRELVEMLRQMAEAYSSV